MAEAQYDAIVNTYTLGCKDLPYRVSILRPSIARMLEEVQNIKEKTLLDLGCGDGVNTQRIYEDLKPLKMVGVDVSNGIISFNNNNTINLY